MDVPAGRPAVLQHEAPGLQVLEEFLLWMHRESF